MLSILFSVLAFASIPQANDLAQDSVVRSGDHFRLVCHFQDEKVAEQALVAAELAWEYGTELYDRQGDNLKDLLEIHLYRNAADYRAADQKITGGQFQKNLAFAHFRTVSAHVAVQPPLSDGALARIGLPAQTRRLLAHEAAHLVRYSVLPNFQDHPRWLADGAASWIDEQASRDMTLIDRVEEDPKFSSAILRVQSLLKDGDLPSLHDLLNDEVMGLGFFEGYDVRWIFFHFLLQSKEEKRFLKIVRKVRSIGGGHGFTERYFEEISKIWNEKRLHKIEESFHVYIQALEPSWEEVYRNLYFDGTQWVQAAFDSNAIAWRREPSGKKYAIQGELTILPGQKQQMNLFLGRSQSGFFSIAFSAQVGITLFEYEGGNWNRRAHFPLESLALGEAFPFQVDVDGTKVSVAIHGKELGSVSAESLDLSGPWGLSAQANSAGLWKILKAPAFK